MSRFLVTLGCVILGCHIGAGTASPQALPSAEQLAEQLQQRYATVFDFSADFVHSYRGGFLRTETRERGTVLVKKPGMMRWTYTSPERKEFVSNGRLIYAHIPEDRQVIVTDVPAENSAGTPALFLTGKGDIARDFVAAYVDVPVAAGEVALKLTPRRAESEYEFLIVVLDQETLQIRALTSLDLQGGESTLTFANLQENRGLLDQAFDFYLPADTDVIDNSSN